MLRPRDPQARTQTAGRHASVSAAVAVGDIREAFYNDVLTMDQMWWWIREIRLNPMELIVDDDDGGLYRVPFTVNADDTVTFQMPMPVEIQYVDVPAGQEDGEDGGEQQWPVTVAAAAPEQVMAARWASRVEAGRTVEAAAVHAPMTGTHSHPHPTYGTQGGDAAHAHAHTHNGDANHDHEHTPMAAATPEGALTVPLRRAEAAEEPSSPTEPSRTTETREEPAEGDDMQLSPEMLQALGLSADATLEQQSEALNAHLGITPPAADEPAPVTDVEPAPIVAEEQVPVAASGQTIPEGMVVIDANVLAHLQRGAQAGIALAEREAQTERTRRVDAAIAAGRILRNDRDAWITRLSGPDGASMATCLEQLPAVVPVREIGYAGGDLTAEPVPTAYPRSFGQAVSASRRSSDGPIFVGND